MYFIDIIYHFIAPQRFSLNDILDTAKNIMSGRILVDAREKEIEWINQVAGIIGSDVESADLVLILQQFMNSTPYSGSIRSALFTHRFAIDVILENRHKIISQLDKLCDELEVQVKIAEAIGSHIKKE